MQKRNNQLSAFAGKPAGAAGRLLFPDSMRGVAALAVSLYHFYSGSWITDVLGPVLPSLVDTFLNYCYLGLEVFFVLSGFVIALSLKVSQATIGGITNFALRRQIRLDPPYWVTMGLQILLFSIYTWMGLGKPPIPSPQSVLAHLFYLQTILGYENIVVIFWTLCIEVQFYLVFSLLLFAMRVGKIGHGKATIVFLPLFFWSLAIYFDYLPNAHRGLFLPQWHMFHLGMIVSWAYTKQIPRAVGWNYLAFYALVVAAVSLHSGKWHVDGTMVLVIALLFHAVAGAGKMQSFLAWRGFLFLGTLSYSYYLLHVIIGGRIINLASRVSMHPAAAVLWFLLAIAGTIATAWVLHRFVEKPAMELSRKFKRSK